MRVAHITDLHVEVRPHVGELFNKRVLGAVNLYLMGRSAHFTLATVEGLVQAIVELRPDLVLCTGDLTASGTEAEFERARAVLEPLTDSLPFLAIPGNHDVYTRESVGRFMRHFGKWAGDFPVVHHQGGVDFVAIDVSRPDVLSRGLAPAGQLASLDHILGEGTAPAVVLLHYPLRDRRGEPYGPFTRAIENGPAIEAVLARHARVCCVLHGHEHHGYRTTIPRDGAPILSLDPGASGYAYLPEKGRTAHFNVYELDGSAPDGGLQVERWAWNGRDFAPEAGGAYATGG
jgi:Icc protein